MYIFLFVKILYFSCFRYIDGTGTKHSFPSNSCCEQPNYVRYVEHVVVKISVQYSRRGDMVIILTSPMGTNSTLLPKRSKDFSNAGFSGWEFMSTHYWGENPFGYWHLYVLNAGKTSNRGKLIVYLDMISLS